MCQAYMVITYNINDSHCFRKPESKLDCTNKLNDSMPAENVFLSEIIVVG